MSENNFQDYSNLSSTFSYHGKHSGFQPYHEMTNFSNSSNFLKFLTSSQKIFSELDPDTSLVKEYKIEQGKIEQHQSGKQQESQRQKSLINQKVYEEEERKVQFIESSENEQSKRKKNQQIHRDIKTKKQDLGRGGNCVASNIVKTFIRIIESLLGKQPLEIFRKQVKTYSLKSQKENAIIILLLLHILVKQEKIKWTVYEKIIEEFSRNLKDSESNCEKKARKQSDRKVFHQKNRKMYVRFYEIIAEIYQKSRQNVKSQGQQKYSLEDLQQSVADTYERKQRQVQKAMSKIKSIILNHRPLQQFFDYYQNQIQSAFYEALDFAYRRNLSKRSKKVLDSTKRIFQKLDMKNTSNQKEKYMICYMATKLIHDKQEKIWSEFINNLLMKNKFNKSTQEVEALKICLEKEIPDSFRSFEQQKMKHLSNSVQKKQKDSPCKIQQEQSDYREKPHIFRVFNQLKDSLDF